MGSDPNSHMPLNTLRDWLGLGARPLDTPDQTPLRDLVETLEHLEPEPARHLARFAYLLGRIARADLHVSPEETRAMEALVVEVGGLTADEAVVVVGLAKSSNLLFGSTADFLVAKEFAESASYEQKLALMKCLFRLAATDAAILDGRGIGAPSPRPPVPDPAGRSDRAPRLAREVPARPVTLNDLGSRCRTPSASKRLPRSLPLPS